MSEASKWLEPFNNLKKKPRRADTIVIILLTLQVPEILPYLEVPSGVKLTLRFIDAFYIF